MQHDTTPPHSMPPGSPLAEHDRQGAKQVGRAPLSHLSNAASAEKEWQSLSTAYALLKRRAIDAEKLRDSTSFRVGHLLVTAVRRPWNLPTTISLARAERRARRSNDATETRTTRPPRSTVPLHPDQELLWSQRPDPTGVFDFLIGVPPADTDEVYELFPHDTLALLGSSTPRSLVIDSAANRTIQWFGIGTPSRRHLEKVLDDAIDLCHRRGIRVAIWWTTDEQDSTWLAPFLGQVDAEISSGARASEPIRFPRAELDDAFPASSFSDHQKPTHIPSTSSAGSARQRRIVFAGHDLKFARTLMQLVEHRGGFEVRSDEWSTLSTHDPAASAAASAWADIVVCEWCGQNAVWYSKNKRAGQQLVIRLHRFELDTVYVRNVNWTAVDRVVVVSEHFRELTRKAIPRFPADRIITIPNGVDVSEFNRPKDPGSRFRVGMVGFVPQRKRLDRALSILRAVRREDPRFALYLKGPLPWDHGWVWQNRAERAYFTKVFGQIQCDELLGGAVAIDPPGADVAAWLQAIGCVVSTSDDESFHLAPAEGMASGSVPVVFDWPAARSVYAERWICSSIPDAAEHILRLADLEEWEEASGLARKQARAFDVGEVARLWLELLTGDNSP